MRGVRRVKVRFVERGRGEDGDGDGAGVGGAGSSEFLMRGEDSGTDTEDEGKKFK